VGLPLSPRPGDGKGSPLASKLRGESTTCIVRPVLGGVMPLLRAVCRRIISSDGMAVGSEGDTNGEPGSPSLEGEAIALGIGIENEDEDEDEEEEEEVVGAGGSGGMSGGGGNSRRDSGRAVPTIGGGSSARGVNAAMARGGLPTNGDGTDGTGGVIVAATSGSGTRGSSGVVGADVDGVVVEDEVEAAAAAPPEVAPLPTE